MKKRSTTPRAKLVRKLDSLCREWVLLRDKRCVCCGKTENLQCGHLFTRSAYSTRWDGRNIYVQCSACNMRHEYDPGPLTVFFLKKFGQKEYEDLHKQHKTPQKFSEYDLECRIAEVENIIKYAREHEYNSSLGSFSLFREANSTNRDGSEGVD